MSLWYAGKEAAGKDPPFFSLMLHDLLILSPGSRLYWVQVSAVQSSLAFLGNAVLMGNARSRD